MTDKIKYLFVINKGAGKDNFNWKEEIVKYFSALDIRFDIYILPKKIVPKNLREKIELSDAETIVAVGGDGTVNLVAAIIQNSPKKLGILPAGSANGMARELGIPAQALKAMELLNNGVVKHCDSILINKKYPCIHLSDIGMNARLIKYFDEGKFRGKWGYYRMLVKTMWRRKKMMVTFKTKDDLIRSEAVMLVIANTGKYGTGAVINPLAVLDDGLFELVLVKKLSFTSLVTMMFKPGLFNPKHIEIFQCQSVEIKTKHRVHFQIDGEYLGKIKDVQAEVQPHSLQIILPKTT